MKIIRLAICLVILSATGFFESRTLNAQSTEEARDRLAQIETDIKASESRRANFEAQAEDAAEQAEELGERLVTYARRQRRQENEIARLRQRLDDLAKMNEELAAKLLGDEENLVHLLAALERLGRRPAALSIFQPGSAIDTARSVSVISGVVPLVDARATELRGDLESLARVTDATRSERASLEKTSRELSASRKEVQNLITARRQEARTAREGASTESDRVRRLQAEAKDLQELLEEIFRRRPLAKPTPPGGDRPEGTRPNAVPNRGTILSSNAFKAKRGDLVLPVIGRTILSFGEKDGVLNSKGMRFETATSAQVLAPYDGRIAFAAPFRDFGQVLIIEHAEGYHSLLAGLALSYAEVGQLVLAGEPVGAMAGADTAGVRAGVNPELYLELRQAGKSVDPAPWYRRELAANR